jgi:hypothetical protein
MSLRETINSNRWAKISLSVVALIAVAIVIGMQFRGPDSNLGDGKRMFISFDDGKTFVTDASEQLPPFTVDGKTAYKVNVFTCGDKTRFVGYLERYTPAGKKMMAEQRQKQQASHGMPTFNAALLEGIEIKRPGEKEWIKESDTARANKILDVICPKDNTPAEPVIP